MRDPKTEEYFCRHCMMPVAWYESLLGVGGWAHKGKDGWHERRVRCPFQETLAEPLPKGVMVVTNEREADERQ